MEAQNYEWKEIWRDEHMKTLCAFANTGGGTLEIGRDDRGVVIGVKNVKKLLVFSARMEGHGMAFPCLM